MHIRKDLPPVFSDAILIRAEAGLGITNKELTLLIYSCGNKYIKIFKDGYGKPIGYLAWSKISNDTLRMMSLYNGQIKYSYERNDGHIYLLNDIVFIHKNNPKHQEHWQSFIRKKIRVFVVIRKNKVTLYRRRNGKHWPAILHSISTNQ